MWVHYLFVMTPFLISLTNKRANLFLILSIINGILFKVKLNYGLIGIYGIIMSYI